MDETLTSQLHLWTQRLRAIALTGLAFNPPVYDAERYQELLRLASEMAATDAAAVTDRELAGELYEHWRAEVKPGPAGYVTPQVGVGTIVFNQRDELLLVQRPNGYWYHPTGWCDPGLSPAQVAVKEVAEETGLKITPLRLIAVYNLERSDLSAIIHHLYSLVFYCHLDGGDLTLHPLEVRDAGFFSLDHLPEPLLRPGLGWVEMAARAHRGELTQAYFDQP